MSKKAEALQTKIEDVKSEVIDNIARTMEKNGVEEHEFKRPGRYGCKTLKGLEYDKENEVGPYVKLDRREGDLLYEDELEAIEELDADKVLFILYNFEDEFEVS